MEVTIIKSNRRTVAIQVNSDLTVTVRAPRWISKREIERILKDKESWILKNIEKMRIRNTTGRNATGRDATNGSVANGDATDGATTNVNRLTSEEIKKLSTEASKYIPERVAYFSKIVGVSYGRITIRNQKTRWGSCSSKGNLNFNCLLMLTPPEVIDYVVVHELCHRKQMNHSKAFWNEVAKVCPDYKTQVKWLRTEGKYIHMRAFD